MYRLRIRARDEAHADHIADALIGAIEPDTTAVGTLEVENGWFAEGFYLEEPAEAGLKALLTRALGPGADGLKLTIEALADRDWVRESLEAMPPVFAGRFAVCGAHDRTRIPANAVLIEIEAGQAFGTGHHGTTKGCLLALDDLFRRRRFRRPLDVGTGTGVLAIAIAKGGRISVIATDIDPVAVDITRENAAKNGVRNLVAAVAADGVRTRNVADLAPYDLVVANILARPLIGLAPDIARIATRHAAVVLSGLLTWQRREVEAAWRARGFVPIRRYVLDGWATLALEARKASAGPKKRSPGRRWAGPGTSLGRKL